MKVNKGKKPKETQIRQGPKREPKAKSQKPKAKSQKPKAKSQKPKAKSEKPMAKARAKMNPTKFVRKVF